MRKSTAALTLLSLSSLALLSGCHSHNYTQRGAATGGLGGAGLGAVIGEIASDEPLAGAAIGSAVGALSGAAVGSGLDKIDARSRYRTESLAANQAVYQQPIGTSMNEIISMSNAGLSDQIISRHIRTQGFGQSLDAGDLIALRQQGVSDAVIADLQDSSIQSPVRIASAQQVITPAPVIVEELYHAVPVPYGPRRYRRRGPGYRPRLSPGLHWGVAFGH